MGNEGPTEDQVMDWNIHNDHVDEYEDDDFDPYEDEYPVD